MNTNLRRHLLPAVLLAGLVIFQIGYSFGEPNHLLLLPWIMRRVDPTLLANDWLSNTIPHHFSFVIVMSWLAKLAPLPLAMLVLHALTVVFLIAVIERLVSLLFDGRRVFYLALFLLLRWGTSGLGGNSLWAH